MNKQQHGVDFKISKSDKATVPRIQFIFSSVKIKWKHGLALFAIVLMVTGHVYMRNTNTVYNLFFLPDDLYKPLATSSLNPEKFEYVFEVSHNYPGSYSVGVDAPTSGGIGVMYENLFKTSVRIKSDGEEVYWREMSDTESNYWRDIGGGLTLDIYDVPELIEKDKLVSISVSTSGNVSRFLDKYGDSKIVISKYSDK